MKLLLHTCCGDCLIRYLEVVNCRPQDDLLRNPDRKSDSQINLSLEDITLYFANSNIYPKSEYDARLEVVRNICKKYQLPLVIADYQPDQYFETVKEATPESIVTTKSISNSKNLPTSSPTLVGGSSLSRDCDKKGYFLPPKSQRCFPCWQLRLSQTFSHAQKNEFTHFSTTLLVSQYQNATQLSQIGQKLATSTKPSSAQPNFLSPQFLTPDTSHTASYRTGGFYKQNYCGCLFSLIERTQEKYPFSLLGECITS